MGEQTHEQRRFLSILLLNNLHLKESLRHSVHSPTRREEAIADLSAVWHDANQATAEGLSCPSLAADSSILLISSLSTLRSLRRLIEVQEVRPSVSPMRAVAQQSVSVNQKSPTSFPLLARLMVTAIMVMILVVVLRMIVTVATLIAGAVPLRRQRSTPGRKYGTNRFALKRPHLL